MGINAQPHAVVQEHSVKLIQFDKLEVACSYKRCINAMKWLMGACSHSDIFNCIYIARQRDMNMKRSGM